MPPELQSITSTPSGLTRFASSTLCAGPQPASSSAESRRNKGLPAGQFARTASHTSQAKRMRLASEPP